MDCSWDISRGLINPNRVTWVSQLRPRTPHDLRKRGLVINGKCTSAYIALFKCFTQQHNVNDDAHQRILGDVSCICTYPCFFMIHLDEIPSSRLSEASLQHITPNTMFHSQCALRLLCKSGGRPFLSRVLVLFFFETTTANLTNSSIRVFLQFLCRDLELDFTSFVPFYFIFIGGKIILPSSARGHLVITSVILQPGELLFQNSILYDMIHDIAT